MEVVLKRDPAWRSTHTMGELTIGGVATWQTIERPWLDNRPFESCVPLGTYDLVPFVRPDGTETFALHNEDLGVYVHPSEVPPVPHRTRTLILLHPGNYVTDVVGCVAPGKGRNDLDNMVTSSRAAFEEIMLVLDRANSVSGDHRMTICR